MTPRWGRKRCSRRICRAPHCVPMPRPCLDSLRIPRLPPCALQRPPKTEFIPHCVQPTFGIKYPICHCADRNYCTAETCSNSINCMQSKNFYCPYGLKKDKDEDSVCLGPCRQQEGDERNYLEDYEKDEPACYEASCEQLQNCGVGATSNEEEITHPVIYTPSVTNQKSLSRIAPTVPSRQVLFTKDSVRDPYNINDPSLSTVSFTARGMSPKSINFNERNKLSNINRYIQINMQNETVSQKGTDAEWSVVSGAGSVNETPNSLKLLELSQCQSINVNKLKVPVQNTKSTLTERYNTNAQSCSQSCKTSESHLNSYGPTVDNNGGFSRDNNSLTDVNNNKRIKTAVNPCCTYSYDLPTSFEPKFEEQLNYPEKREISDKYSKNYDVTQPNAIPIQFVAQETSGTNKEHLHIQNDSENIIAKENIPTNLQPSTNINNNNKLSQTKTTPQVNVSTTEKSEKKSFSGNNFTNQRRLLNENQNQFMRNAPNDCCLSGSTQGNFKSFISDSQKPPKFNAQSYANIQPNRSNNNLNNSTYPSPVGSQRLKCNIPSQSKMQVNDNRFKDIHHKVQTTNCDFDQKYGGISEDCQQDCCSHGSRATTNKRDLLFYKPIMDLDCVCPDEEKRKNKEKFGCVIEDGTTSCASAICIVNQEQECCCRYPPAFKQFSCTGNISGICNCTDKK